MDNSKAQMTRVAAYGLVSREENDEARMLLCRLSPEQRYAGYWTLPGGGIDFGENPRDAVVREFQEETGLDIRVDDLLTIDSLHLEGDDHEFHALRILYRVSIIGGRLRDEIDGSTDTCAWLSAAEIAAAPLVELAELGVSLVFPSH